MSSDYARIESAIRFLQQNARAQPDLTAVASHVGLSPYHFQRLFSRWAGVSPKRFLEYITLSHAKRLLQESRSVLDAAFASGLSGPGRLHDHFVTIDAMTPGEFKRGGEGLDIAYGVHDTPYGEILLLATGRGVCGLSFLDHAGVGVELANARKSWPGAVFSEQPSITGASVQAAFGDPGKGVRIPLLVRGTNFQINVWRGLLKIPSGSLLSYRDLAVRLGMPRATRSVASAIAANPVGYLIPCHRVIRGSGETGGYHWGLDRKQLMLARESVQMDCTEDSGVN